MNMGAVLRNMSIVEREALAEWSVTFYFGQHLTKAIQQQFQCDVKTAEQKKWLTVWPKNPADAEAQHVERSPDAHRAAIWSRKFSVPSISTCLRGTIDSVQQNFSCAAEAPI